MKICIKNCILISMEENREKIEYDMDILIEDKKILLIDKEIKVDESVKIINAKNKVVMPGLINTHSHVSMSIFREMLEGYNLQEWLKEKVWPIEDKLTNEDSYYASYLSFIEMIKTGTTTINDMYFLPEGTIQAMLESGIRLQTTRTVMNIDGEEKGKKRISELKEITNKYLGKYDRLTLNLAIHSLYTANQKYIKECLKFAKKHNLSIHLHFCENETEVNDINKSYNQSPIEVLKSNFKNTKLILAHCVKVDEQDIKEMKELDVNISHCPISNLKLGCGIAKVDEMLKNNINVSLGTDGQGSGNNLDLFEVMQYTALLQKGIQEDPTVLGAYEVLKMATINGAKALGLQDIIGSIKEGKSADIIILDINDVKMKPINNIISEIVYNAKGNNVITTIINGKILMEDRKLLDTKEQEIYEKCEKILRVLE